VIFLLISRIENGDVLFSRGPDSGVGAEEEEEWVSDTEVNG